MRDGMRYDSDKHHRRSVRLAHYDYRQEAVYFVTICAYQQACLFGQIQDMIMHLNKYGQIASACWDDIPKHFPHVECDVFVVMPNHIHGILVIVNDSITKPNTMTDDTENHNVATGRGLPWQAPTDTPSSAIPQTTPPNTPIRQFSKPVAGSIGMIINAYKSSVTRIIRQTYPDMTDPIWQRNYHEHIIRDEIALMTIRNYIEHNPTKWEQDKFYGK